MPYVVALWLVVWGLSCELGAKQQSYTNQSEIQTSNVVRVDVRSEAMVFEFHSRAGKLVPVGLASDVGVQTADGSKSTLEYFSENAHWAWIGSAEATRFVRRADVVGEPYADNPDHSYLKKYTVKEFARAGLPRWTAKALGSCPEYEFGVSGRLEPVPVGLRYASEGSSYPDVVQFAAALGDYVLGGSLTVTSNHCLGPHKQLSEQYYQVPDARDRDAYVLGAGGEPMHEQRGAFLMLLSQQYRNVYVNDIVSADPQGPNQNLVNREYALRCPPHSESIDPGSLYYDRSTDFCDIVTEVPENIDFRYMNLPAKSLPTITGGDIFVVFPYPSWMYAQDGPFEKSIYSLGSDLRNLLGDSTVAYVVTENNLLNSESFPYFEHDSLNIDALSGVDGMMDIHRFNNAPPAQTFSFSTRSRRWVTVLSPVIENMQAWNYPIHLFQITRAP